MDEQLRTTARRRHGLVLAAEAAALPAAERRALVVVQPGVLVAQTQPLDAATAVAAAELSKPRLVLAGRTALWVHGVGDPGDAVDVAVPARQVVLHPPVRVRRLAPSLLTGVRTVDGHQVVSVETAVVQRAELAADAALLTDVEDVLRQRLTTLDRLRRRCRRGVKGSAALRGALEVVSDGDLDALVRDLRRALQSAGVVGLESEVLVRSSSGTTAYLDLLHRPSGNAFEVDGWSAHTDRSRFVADRRRDRWVRREHGIATTRLAADELRRDLAGVVRDELLPLLRTRRAA